MTLYNNELIHYGVKGMKWGRRKDRDSGGSGSSRGIRKKIVDRDAEIKRQRKSVADKEDKLSADLTAKKITSKEANKKLSEIYKEHPRSLELTSKEIVARAGLKTAVTAVTLATLSSYAAKDAQVRSPGYKNEGGLIDAKRGSDGVYNITNVKKR